MGRTHLPASCQHLKWEEGDTSWNHAVQPSLAARNVGKGLQIFPTFILEHRKRKEIWEMPLGQHTILSATSCDSRQFSKSFWAPVSSFVKQKNKCRVWFPHQRQQHPLETWVPPRPCWFRKPEGGVQQSVCQQALQVLLGLTQVWEPLAYRFLGRLSKVITSGIWHTVFITCSLGVHILDQNKLWWSPFLGMLTWNKKFRKHPIKNFHGLFWLVTSIL